MDIPLENFTSIDLKGNFRVFLVQGDKNFVNVETYPNVRKNLDINVDDKILTIKESRSPQNIDFYNLTISMRYSPERVVLSDSLELNVSGALNSDRFRLNLKNNAKFIGAIRSRTAEVEMENTSRANFLGFTKDATLKIRDTASLIAPYWKIDNLLLEAGNGSYAEVNVKDSLKGSVNQTAKLLYYNDPIRAFKIAKTAVVTNKKLD